MFTAGMALMLFGGLFFVNRALAETAKPVAKAGERLVTIYDRGTERTIVTKARTVREALKLAKLSIDERQDVVEPGLDSEMVAERYNVNIFRARPVTIVDGGKRLRVTTAQQTPILIAKAAGLEIFNEDKTTVAKADNIVKNCARNENRTVAQW
jgi:transglycosylase-like protein